ncbi:hypothetical protein PoB_000016400 [Plakobranchus ocellatus]|uniref:Uncharacterized protein n=1 Tax=Plakobranchus ocellatus TaxID=259542 RepID=A0AAV3XV66_9GAST|nr:hypothetical protein PoB_000016400 [Plakobranchus ocellatus]
MNIFTLPLLPDADARANQLCPAPCSSQDREGRDRDVTSSMTRSERREPKNSHRTENTYISPLARLKLCDARGKGGAAVAGAGPSLQDRGYGDVWSGGMVIPSMTFESTRPAMIASKSS